ncbi:hypothetical protein [Halorubrum salinum]|uniref:hypothetical protein n=1 Tax=Halorubrum salinum TaxID=767517 RepID=UPI0021124793|nr:hypothetical protein [Halorubrum salinum]
MVIFVAEVTGHPAADLFFQSVEVALAPLVAFADGLGSLLSPGAEIASAGGSSMFEAVSQLPVPIMMAAVLIVFKGILDTVTEPVTHEQPVTLTGDEQSETEDELAGTVTVWSADGEALRFDEDEFEPRRLRVGDRLTWVADHEGEPVELDVDRLGFDPAERARQAYVDDEIDEDELERRLGHDLELEVEDVE